MVIYPKKRIIVWFDRQAFVINLLVSSFMVVCDAINTSDKPQSNKGLDWCSRAETEGFASP